MPSNPPPNVLQSTKYLENLKAHGIKIWADKDTQYFKAPAGHKVSFEDIAKAWAEYFALHPEFAPATPQGELQPGQSSTAIDNLGNIVKVTNTGKFPFRVVEPTRGAEQVAREIVQEICGLRLPGNKVEKATALISAATDEAVGEYRKALERIASYRDRAYEENIVMGYPDRPWKDEDLEAIEDIVRAALNPEKEEK